MTNRTKSPDNSETVDKDTTQQNQQPKNKGGRPPSEAARRLREARANLEDLAIANAAKLFELVKTAAENGDMTAARMLWDRLYPSRRGCLMQFEPINIGKPQDVAVAYENIMAQTSLGKITLEEANMLDLMVERRGKAFELITMAQELDELKARLETLTTLRVAA